MGGWTCVDQLADLAARSRSLETKLTFAMEETQGFGDE